MPGLQLTLLGGFEARLGAGTVLTIASRKSRALLAYLAVAGQRAQPRDPLAALLWGDVPDDQSRQSLRKALWDLRHVLAAAPAALSTDSETVVLTPERVDVLEFQRLVRDGRPAALRAAMELYRGDLLEGFRVAEPAFEEWLTRQRERFRLLLVEALERSLGLEAAEGRMDAAGDAARRLLAMNPAHEVAHRTLISLYARQGRRDAALRQYRACADALWRDLGAKPGPETERAYRDVTAASTAARPSGPPRVLVVEDEVVTQTLLRELLAGAGYEVVVAADGAEALFHLSRDTFQLVVADIWMPLLDGVKLLEIMRDKRAATPVVLITGRANAELEARCLAMGAADYVTKPFAGPALLARLAKALRRAQDVHAR